MPVSGRSNGIVWRWLTFVVSLASNTQTPLPTARRRLEVPPRAVPGPRAEAPAPKTTVELPRLEIDGLIAEQDVVALRRRGEPGCCTGPRLTLARRIAGEERRSLVSRRAHFAGDEQRERSDRNCEGDRRANTSELASGSASKRLKNGSAKIRWRASGEVAEPSVANVNATAGTATTQSGQHETVSAPRCRAARRRRAQAAPPVSPRRRGPSCSRANVPQKYCSTAPGEPSLPPPPPRPTSNRSRSTMSAQPERAARGGDERERDECRAQMRTLQHDEERLRADHEHARKDALRAGAGARHPRARSVQASLGRVRTAEPETTARS